MANSSSIKSPSRSLELPFKRTRTSMTKQLYQSQSNLSQSNRLLRVKLTNTVNSWKCIRRRTRLGWNLRSGAPTCRPYTTKRPLNLGTCSRTTSCNYRTSTKESMTSWPTSPSPSSTGKAVSTRSNRPTSKRKTSRSR